MSEQADVVILAKNTHPMNAYIRLISLNNKNMKKLQNIHPGEILKEESENKKKELEKIKTLETSVA